MDAPVEAFVVAGGEAGAAGEGAGEGVRTGNGEKKRRGRGIYEPATTEGALEQVSARGRRVGEAEVRGERMAMRARER